MRAGGQAQEDPDALLGDLFPELGPDATLEVDGRSWPLRERAVVMLNKPRGYECSLKPRHHPSVMSLLPSPLRLRGLQPIGRLDEDTTGLLLLTDDGELNHRLTSPKWHAAKVYRVGCKHPMAEEARDRLVAGVVLDDNPEPVRALAVELLGTGHPAPGNTADTAEAPALHYVDLTIGEGRYHQVKRMVAAVSNRVETLHRTRMGGLELDPALPTGQWRWLTIEEEAALRAAVRLD